MKTRGLGPQSRRHRFGQLDGRTFEAKHIKEFRAQLLAHIGGAPTVPQAALIERACWVSLRCALMDSKVATGDFTEQDSAVYLAWANTLRRMLEALGLEPASAKPVDPVAAVHAALAAAAAQREAAEAAA